MKELSNIEQVGRIHLYVGDGKGKTTAAVGLAARALGAGKRVLFCQFLKGRPTSEIKSLEALGAEIIRAKCGTKFIFEMNEAELKELANAHELCYNHVCERACSGEIDALILDEIVDAVNSKLLPQERLLELIKGRPDQLEIIMTGRNPSDEIIAAADYYTEFLCHKHPYKSGVKARKGIEF